MRFVRQKDGQTIAAAVVLVMLLLVVAAALTDGLNLLSTRQRCLKTATEAALRAASWGRDYSHYVHHGTIAVNVADAEAEATSWLTQALAQQGLAATYVRIETLPYQGGGSVSDFPRAGDTWTASEPSVGVYIEIPVDTVMMGVINGGQPVTLHVFGAAGVISDI